MTINTSKKLKFTQTHTNCKHLVTKHTQTNKTYKQQKINAKEINKHVKFKEIKQIKEEGKMTFKK
jgi:hypothetical protein